MNRTFSFYDTQTGLFTRKRVTCADTIAIGTVTPPGCAAIEGTCDPESQRVDLATGAVIEYEPPHEEVEHRERERRRAQAQARIEQLEHKQMRPLRELQLDPGSREAYVRLREIEVEIAAARESLGGV